MGSAFTYPTAPVPKIPAAPAGDVSAQSSAPPVQCPPGQHAEGTMCVADPTGPPAKTPATGGGGPGSCTNGQVWRNDTKMCEDPDARQKLGQDTCGGALPNCPPGQDVWCDFDDQQFKCAQSSGWSDSELCRVANKKRGEMGKPEKSCAELGYGGGGGGGARSSAQGGAGAFGSTDFDAMMRKQYQDMLAQPSRFTPEVMQHLKGELARQASNSITRGERAVKQNAAQRNMQRSGAVGAALRGVHDVAEQQRGTANVQVEFTKIQADHQDKLDALDRAQKYLDSLRDNEYRYALMGEQRRQFDSNLALAYAGLSQQRSMLQMQLQSSWDMLKAQQGFYLLTQGTGR